MTRAVARDPIYRRRRFSAETIELCVRWYITYRLSYRDLVAMVAERGIAVSHTTILRWVLRYAPEFEKRWARYARPVNASWRMDETAVSVRGGKHYLYRAVDRQGKSVEHLLCADRSRDAAQAFFRKAVVNATEWPRTVNMDGNLASHLALRMLGEEDPRWQGVVVRNRRYLNNVVEQDHRAIKSRCAPMLGFKSFGSAAITLAGIELLPGRDLRIAALGLEPDPNELNALADAMLEFLGHQTEHSTDVRWLVVLYGGLSHKIHYQATMAERVDEIIHYPNHGDLRKVRPSIRASEPIAWMGSDGREPAFPWSEIFWRECHERTACIVVEPEGAEVNQYKPGDIEPRVIQALNDVSNHWIRTSKTTTVDAAHEGSFTFVLYALTCLLEMVGRNRLLISGRLLLRTVAECRITFAYLLHKNDPELWRKFRAYGAGQAKLVLLKMKEIERPPHSISMEPLERLANEDVWQEYVDIDLGNWAGADLSECRQAESVNLAMLSPMLWKSSRP